MNDQASSDECKQCACDTCNSCQRIDPPAVYKGESYSYYCKPDDTFMVRGPDACVLKHRLAM